MTVFREKDLCFKLGYLSKKKHNRKTFKKVMISFSITNYYMALSHKDWELPNS